MTPYTPRNFAIGGPTAREGQLDRFFFAKMVFYMHEEDQDQLKGAKNMELLPKITDFLRPLSLA